MADLLSLFTNLLSDLRTSFAKSGASFSEIEELLYGGTAASMAQKLIDEKRQKGKLAEVSEADLWRALIESIVEAASADAANAPMVASDSFEKRLTALASEANRNWLISIPVDAEAHDAIVESLTTAAALRIIVIATDEPEMSRRFGMACQKFGETAPTATLPLRGHSPAVFVISGRGGKETALRQAVRSLNVSRDALRVATHLQPGKIDLDSPSHVNAQTNLTDVVLFDIAQKRFHDKIERNLDTVLGPVEALNNAKVRALYDRAARVLERCPEDARKQPDLIWRIARSIRIFSRAVGVSNRDLRFLLTVIAYEAVLNRSDAPIAEALSEYGALLTQDGVDYRVERARELKVAYKVRSLFVHEGRLPSEQLDEDNMRKISRLVFHTWAETMRRLLPFADQRLTDKDFFDRLVQLKFGATFDDVFTILEQREN
jgi:Apea-like HEPN